MSNETENRRARVIADEWLRYGDAAGRVNPGYMISAGGDEGPLIGPEAKAAFERHLDRLPAGARLVQQVTIKGYPVTFYDQPRKRSFLARLADSVRGRK